MTKVHSERSFNLRNVIIQAVQKMLKTVYKLNGGTSKLRYRSDSGRRRRDARIFCLVTKYLNHVEQYALFEKHCDRAR
jgi:hypothetical protein